MYLFPLGILLVTKDAIFLGASKQLSMNVNYLAAQFDDIKFSHVFRETNFTADDLANLRQSYFD